MHKKMPLTLCGMTGNPGPWRGESAYRNEYSKRRGCASGAHGCAGIGLREGRPGIPFNLMCWF